MAKYLLKSKILATLNETLNKIKLLEADAKTTPPEMDGDGNFISSVESQKQPSGRGVEVEKQSADLSKEEILNKAIEEIKNSDNIAKDLEYIIQKITGEDHLSNKWKVNDDHNDVYLQSKDAHIFQQNNNICLSHNGKIEIFNTVEELHNWLNEHKWPLPPQIEIHESKDILIESSLSTICNSWNALVDYANGEVADIIERPDKKNPNVKNFYFQYKNGSLLKLGEFVTAELKKIDEGQSSLDLFKNQKKFSSTKELKTKPQIVHALGLDGASKEEIKTNPILNWISKAQVEKTQKELGKADSKTIGLNGLANSLNNASNGKNVTISFGSNYQLNINKDNFLNSLNTMLGSLRKPQDKLNVCNAVLNNKNIPLASEFVDQVTKWKEAIESRIKQLSQRESTNNVSDKINNLLESSKKYPWLNEIINKNLITEDDTIAGATNNFDNAVAGAGGMDLSSDTTSSTDNTDTELNLDNDLGDLNTDNPVDLGGGGDLNFNLDGGDDAEQSQQVSGPTYTVLDIVFPQEDEDNEENKNIDIKVKMKNNDTGEIIEKPLNDMDIV